MRLFENLPASIAVVPLLMWMLCRLLQPVVTACVDPHTRARRQRRLLLVAVAIVLLFVFAVLPIFWAAIKVAAAAK